MRLTDIGIVKALMEEHGLSFKKHYGQNFLINEAVPKKIAEAGAGENVLEIGPGIGTLTQELAARSSAVCAVEIDASLIPVLRQTLTDFSNVEIVNADVMRLDLSTFCAEHFDGREISVCANLPYYITTPIVMALLESGVRFAQITVMIQREVADRICAAPGSADYGAITAAVAYYGKAEKLFRVSPGSFMPAPKVESTVIRITPYDHAPVECDRELLFRVIRAAFAQRRKTMVNALCSEFSALTKERAAQTMIDCGFDPQLRGERMSVADFAAVARGLEIWNKNC